MTDGVLKFLFALWLIAVIFVPLYYYTTRWLCRRGWLPREWLR